MGQTDNAKSDHRHSAAERRLRIRYAALTIVLFVPLLLAFVSVRNLYPFAASTMMLRDRDPGSHYYVLRGETNSGQIIDLPPINLTNALTGRHWSLVSAAVENKSFIIRSPHPANSRLASLSAGVEELPRAARLEELLRAWGSIYNSRLTEEAWNQKLKSVRLDAYRWEGEINSAPGRLVESWSASL